MHDAPLIVGDDHRCVRRLGIAEFAFHQPFGDVRIVEAECTPESAAGAIPFQLAHLAPEQIDQDLARFVVESERVQSLAGIVIGDDRSDRIRGQCACRDFRFVHEERGEVHRFARQRFGPRLPTELMPEDMEIVLRDHRHTAGAARNDIVGFGATERSLERLDGVPGHLLRGFVIPHIAGGQPAAIEPARIDEPHSQRAHRLDDRHPLFGIEPVGHATGEDSHRLPRHRARDQRWPRGLAGTRRHQILHRSRSRNGQAAPARLRVEDRHLAQPDEPLPGNRSGEPSPHAGDGIECPRARIDIEDRNLLGIHPIGFGDHLAHIENLLRQRNPGRTNGFAGIAGKTERLRLGDRRQSMMESGNDQSDRTGVDMPENMTADFAIGWADIGTGAATNAVQRLYELGHPAHHATAIVDQDDVHFVSGRGSGHEGRIDRHPLSGRTPAEQAQLGHGIVEGGNQLLDSGQHDLHRRNRSGQAPVAFVGHDHDRTGFGNERIRSGHPDPRFEEGGPDFVANRADLLRNILQRDRFVGGEHAIQQLPNLLAPQMQRRPDDMARPLMAFLHDPFAGVGFDHVDAEGFERMVELDLLADHRLALDDQIDTPLLTNLANQIHGIGSRGGGMHLGPSAFGLAGELRQEIVQLIGDVGFDRLELDPHPLEIDLFERPIPVAAPVLLVGADIASQHGVVHCLLVAFVEGNGVVDLFDALVESGVGHPNNSSTKSTATLPGPCTPTVSDISISAVRLGPVTSEA